MGKSPRGRKSWTRFWF